MLPYFAFRHHLAQSTLADELKIGPELGAALYYFHNSAIYEPFVKQSAEKTPEKEWYGLKQLFIASYAKI